MDTCEQFLSTLPAGELAVLQKEARAECSAGEDCPQALRRPETKKHMDALRQQALHSAGEQEAAKRLETFLRWMKEDERGSAQALYRLYQDLQKETALPLMLCCLAVLVSAILLVQNPTLACFVLVFGVACAAATVRLLYKMRLLERRYLCLCLLGMPLADGEATQKEKTTV